ncbi:MAG: hypothetical protein SGILL_000554 [Bacillariaceae sp.]
MLSSGKSLFSSWAKHSFLHESKAGVPILMLTFPILIAATISALFAVRIASGESSRHLTRQYLQCLRNPWFLSTLLVLFPSLVYTVSALHRHLKKSNLTTDKILMEIGNTFGMLAIVAMSWLLIPATKSKGPITKLFHWDPILLVQIFHIWSGRIVVVGGVLHGAFHIVRLGLQSNEILVSYLFPPLACWTQTQEYDPPICETTDKSGCSCYDHFLVFTGLVAGLGLLLIGISSLYQIRRKYFSSFAILHYVLAPLTFVATCIHYNRAILYASGGLLYYLASCYPIWVEWMGKRIRRQSTKIVSIERIDADSTQAHRSCVAVTFEAAKDAIELYRPGVYGHLLVPSISQVAHPFTIIPVPKHPQRIRIIFRVSGNFTRTLQRALCTGVGEDEDQNDTVRPSNRLDTLPDMFFSGYCGAGTLWEKLMRHDACVIVAAGVGITPYLSLFSALQDDNFSGSDGLVREAAPSSTPSKIVLHWVCRDEALIEYCRNQYMNSCLDTASASDAAVSIQVNIHHTGTGEESFSDGGTSDAKRQTPRIHYIDTTSSPGRPFDLSRYESGNGLRENVGYTVVFVVIAWGALWVLWRWYLEQDSDAYMGRLVTVFLVFLYGLVVALFVNVFWHFVAKRRHEGWSQVSMNEEDQGFVDEDAEADGLEMPSYKDNSNENGTSRPTLEASDDNETQMMMTLRMHQGRPTHAVLLKSLHDGVRPALFCCAPSGFTTSLTKTVERSRCSCAAPDVAIYKESFEI